jgi:hypothetical protein
MTENQDMLSHLEALLRMKKSKTFYAERLGITEKEVDELLKEIRERDPETNNTLKTTASNYEAVRKVNNEKGTIESVLIVDFEPKDDLELAALHKINLDKYVITNYWSKVLPNGKFTSSVFSKKKETNDYTAEDFAKFLVDYKSNYIPQPQSEIQRAKLIDVEISLSDFHLAKRHIDGDNSPSVRCKRYFEAATNLIYDVRALYDIDRIVFPISNDFFHTDNFQHATTNGTPQETIIDYAHEYELGFALLVDTIAMLKNVCKELHVVLVQGNHDRTKSYYLAHALDVYFHADPNIYFDREHSVVKATMLGETFIGYHHGNCKIEDLPLLFATHPDYSVMFGCAKYREVHTGDKHHYMAKEVKGVRIQQMPSLSGTDRWHQDNNFVHSVRAALALVYDKELGKISEFEFRL